MPDAHLVFLPWLRSGMAARLTAPDPLTAPLPAQTPLTARLELAGAEGATLGLTLAGPGDVTGIDARQVVRMEPPPGTHDHEANDFAAVEFDNPDLPWLFTPAAPDAQGRLRPWLVLVVVQERDGVLLRAPRTEALPVLEIVPPARPAEELPDLADAWAWAHAQVAAPAGASAAALQSLLASDPDRSVSRLICPRLLEPFTRYLACVVPAFEPGRLSGLNLPITGADMTHLAPAWRSSDSGSSGPAQVALPVYHHWRFSTGAREDFESLVRALVPRDLSALVGRRSMDLSQPGFVFDGGRVGTLPVEGALRPKGMPRAEGPETTNIGWSTALANLINTAAQPLPSGGDPIVGPPLYGRWHAQRGTVGNRSPRTWFDDLNLDPRERVAAALGTQVVQDAQEALVAEAWDQAGELERVNQRLRQLQLSFVVGTRLHTRYVQALGSDDLSLWRLAAPAQARIVWQAKTAAAPAQSLRSFVATRRVPQALFSAPLRRLTRPGGEIARRALGARLQAAPAAPRAGAAFANVSIGRINLLSAQFITPLLSVPAARGLVSFDAVTRRLPVAQRPLAYAAANDRAVVAVPRRPLFQILPSNRLGLLAPPIISPPLGPTLPQPPRPPQPVPPRPPAPPLLDSADARAFREAARRHLAKVNPASAVILGPVVRPALDLITARATLVQRLDPAPALRQRMRATVELAAGQPHPAEAAPLGCTPRYTQPMSEPLAALSQDWLLPGLATVPADTLALLQPNPRFIEAYMAGLNVEIARELLWRDYPLADARGSCFRRFWQGTPAGEDIAPMADWGHRRLGDNAPPGAVAQQSVLLVRSTLFRRYPGALVYAVPALRDARGRKPDGAAQHLQPLFRGALQPDVNFFGFALDPDDAAADPGWYFVIEQQPTEPRFGFDVDIHFAGARHVPLAAPPPGLVLPPNVRWAFNAAHMAQVTRQQPMRVAIHASELLSGLR